MHEERNNTNDVAEVHVWRVDHLHLLNAYMRWQSIRSVTPFCFSGLGFWRTLFEIRWTCDGDGGYSILNLRTIVFITGHHSPGVIWD